MNLLIWTGNPFVDCGIAATIVYCHKNSPNEISKEDLEAMKDLLLEVYTKPAWRKSFHNIFTGNCKLLQNAFKTSERQNEEYKKFLDSLISETQELGEIGNCIACGQRNFISRKSKVEIPMTGSGSSKGFFPSATNGADFCEVCTFMIQCSPLNYYVCGGAKFLIIHSSSEGIKEAWADETIKEINNQISKKEFTGSLNDGFTNPQNALFEITSKIVMNFKKQFTKENPSISIYHFSNYLQNPELYIYEMPSTVFGFVRKMQLETYRENWQRIVRQGFFFRQKGKSVSLKAEKITNEDFKSKKNSVYLDLLDGKPITKRFFSIRKRKIYCDFELLKVYLQEVLFMEEKRIKRIKNLADEIAIFVQQSEKGEKRFKELERATQFRFFCSTLQKISKERLELNPEKPLLTCDDFVKEIFPELPFGFSQVRYIILFRLYEQLHDWLKERKGFSDEAENIKEPAKIETVENYGEDYD